MPQTTSQTDLFSLPINPKLDVDFVEETFIPFLLRHNNLIYDLYFTSRMPPFEQDAMGDVFVSTQSAQDAVANALYISEKTMIPLSATFNNIWVRPDQKNLDTFIKNFKFLYDNGVRINKKKIKNKKKLSRKGFHFFFSKQKIVTTVERLCAIGLVGLVALCSLTFTLCL